MKNSNYKVLDLIESYNIHLKSIFILTKYKKVISFLTRQALVRGYYAPDFFYNLTYSNERKLKTTKL